MPDLIEQLRQIVGAPHVLTEGDLSAWEQDWRRRVHGKALAVVRPASTQEVAAVVKACAAAGAPMVPQGGNTGLSVGSTPDTSGREVVLKRNTNYWGDPNGRPWFDRIVYKVLTDDNAAFQLLARGDLDSMTLTPEDWTRRANTPRFRERFNRFTSNRPAYTYIG